MTGMKRPDVTAEAVARMWLDGASITVIAAHFLSGEATIRRRLAQARELFPDLPWDQRQARPPKNPVKDYVQMNDGRPGPALHGSLIRSGRRARRR